MAIPAAQNSVVGVGGRRRQSARLPGANSMMRELGGVFGIAVTVAVFAGAGSYASPEAFTDGFAPAIGLAAALSLAGAAAGAALPRRNVTTRSVAGRALPALEARRRLSSDSQRRTAVRTASRSALRLWLPGTTTTRRPRRFAGMPNGSLAPCTTSTGRLDRVELVLTRLAGVGSAGSVHGECEAEHGGRARLGRRAARHTRAGRAAAHHERQPAQLAVAQLFDDRDPRLVQPVGRRRRAPPGHQVGLLHERNAEALGLRHLGDRHEVARAHSPTRAMAEHERAQRVLGVVKVDPCGAVAASRVRANAA